MFETLDYHRSQPDNTDAQDEQDVKYAFHMQETNPAFVQQQYASGKQNSPDPYQAIGDLNKDTGRPQAFGKYQWHDTTWDEQAKKYFGVAGKDLPQTPQHQEAVFSSWNKDMTSKGYNIQEKAAMWNGAKMVDGRPVANNKKYAMNVAKLYAQKREDRSQFVAAKQNPTAPDSLQKFVDYFFK